MNNLNPLVTIVSICYNHAQFVCENLDSILNQTYKNVELIIMDDCSTDNSVEVIQNWINENNVKCTFIPHSKNKGVCATMNEAITLSKGKYISLIASDDVMETNKTAIQVEFLEQKGEEYALVCSNFSEINENGKVLNENYFSDDFIFPEDIFNEMLTRSGVLIHSPTILIRKSVFEKEGLYPENYIQEDFYMWLTLSQKYKFGFTSDTLVKYRVLASSLSKNPIYTEKMQLDKIEVLNDLLSKANKKNRETILISIIKISVDLNQYYLKNNRILDYKNQITLQNKYFCLLTENKKIDYIEIEITELFLSNPKIAKEILPLEMFNNLNASKKILIKFGHPSFISLYRNVLRK